jgi:type III restriction enzyme
VPAEYAAIVERQNRKALEDEDRGFAVTKPDVPLGRDARCIISMSMLFEGLDATTVTQVVGLRSFGSRLLCKPMVDRALRRTSYSSRQIFGAPSELIPFKMEGGKPQVPLGPAAAHNHILRRPRNGSRLSEPLQT